jgi:hypothetical protein
MDWTKVRARHKENEITLVVGQPALLMEFYGSGADVAPFGAGALDRYLSVVPPNESVFVLGKADRTYKRLTQQSERRIRHTLSEGGGFYSFKNAAGFEVGDYSFELKLDSSASWLTSNLVFAFPIAWGEAPLVERSVEFFLSIVADIPFWGAVSSFGFDMVWGREFEQAAAPTGFSLARRYQGFLVRDRDQDSRLAELANGRLVERLKSPGWLTFLGKPLCDRVGGHEHLLKVLGPGIELRPIRDGLLLRTGTTPPIGDVNRPDGDVEPLARVGRALSDLCIKKWFDPCMYGVDSDIADAWLRRFE